MRLRYASAVLASLLHMCGLQVTAQCDGSSVAVPYAPSSVFLQQPDFVFNPSAVTSHTLLRTNSANAWTVISAQTDEFNGTSLLTSKWQTGYWWGRTKTEWLNYNPTSSDCPTCIQFSALPVPGNAGNKYLKLNVLKSPITKKVVEWESPTLLLNDGRPNSRSIPYRTGMVCSVEPTLQPYGYFEIRCRLPRTRYTIADFWLHMANNANPASPYYPNDYFYHEMDGFETENARDHHMNAHFKEVCNTPQYDFYKGLRVNGAFDMSSGFFTYAMQWEPNKVVYYLNNKPVHVIHEGQSGWPSGLDLDFDKRMWLILGMEMDSLVGGAGRSADSQPVYPASFDIDYVRAYRRSNYNEPFPTFQINHKAKALAVTAPLIVRTNDPLAICGAGSYSPDNTYFIAVQ